MKRKLNILVVIVLVSVFFNFVYCFADETITLTTYYPAPYGIYKELRANGMAIGIAYRHTPAVLTDGVLIVSDNIGVGTVSPTQKLSVYDGEFVLQTDDNTQDQSILFQNSGGSYTWRIYRKDAGSNYADLRFASGLDASFTSLTDRVTFDKNGNVGIGTADPDTKLHVDAGDVTVESVSTSSPGKIILQNSNEDTSLLLWSGYTQGSNDAAIIHSHDLRFGTATAGDINAGSWSEKVRFTTGGNVGIGTGSPDAKLEVNGNISLYDHQLHNVRALQLKDWDDNTGGTDDKYRLLARDGAWQFYNGGVVVGNYSNGTWSDLADGTLIVEGNVGIGTEDPKSKLDVRGSSNTCVRVNYTSNSGTKNCPPYYYIVLGSATDLSFFYLGEYGIPYPATVRLTNTSGYFICCRACLDNNTDGICD